MQFPKESKLYDYEIEKDSGEDILYINYSGANSVPDLAGSPEVMERTVDILIENPNVSRIVFVQDKNYNYDFNETSYLLEIASLYIYLLKQEKVLSPEKLVLYSREMLKARYNEIFSFLFLLKKDPVAAYTDLKKLLFKANSLFSKLSEREGYDQKNYIDLLQKIILLLEQTSLIKNSQKYLENYSKGSRNIYFYLFKPDIIPNFSFTRLVRDIPKDAEILDQYEISSEKYDVSRVIVLRKKNESKMFYYLIPPEHYLSEEENSLLNLARGVLIEHQPKAEDYLDVQRIRSVFFNLSRDLIRDLADSKKIFLEYSDLNKLATILVRHTIGFGLIEVLLQDQKVQDISLNAPIPKNPVYIRHQTYDECSTNILASKEDSDSWAAKFRMISGRPLDEANPILDTQLEIGGLRSRIAIIQGPLSPDGLAYSLRRHRESPWTLSLFIENKMINPLAAGLLSFLIDGSRTLLVAGTRSSGKCVDGNTLIQLSNGRIVKIKNLLGKHKKKINDGNIFYPSQNNEVFSLNSKDCKIEKRNISDVWKRNSPKNLFKIKTASGKEIITTPEHPYFVCNSGIKNKRSDTLKKGELIATPRKIDVSPDFPEIDLYKTKLKKSIYKETKNYFFLKGNTNSSIIKFPKKITPELSEFVGMVLGDGHLDLNKLEFYNNCKKLRERYFELLRIFNVKYRVFKSHSTMVIQVSSRILSNTLKEVFEIPFGKKADKIKIPQNILQSDNSVLSRFLRGYFDCDGYIPLEKRDIEIVTASKEMSEYLRLALLRFGIVIFSKEKKVKGISYYRNLIRGEFVNKYLKYIGFYHPEKKKRAKKIYEKIFLNNSNIDTIPSGDKILKDLRNLLRISPKEYRLSGKDYWAYENGQYRVTRNWFNNLIKFYSQRQEHLKSMKKETNNLREFVNFDFEEFFKKAYKVKELLNISCSELSSVFGLSPRGINKIFSQENQPSFSTFVKMNNLQKVFSENLNKSKEILSLDFNIQNLSFLMSKGILSYSDISKKTKIPETSIKSYAYLNIKPPIKRKRIIDAYLENVKKDLKEKYFIAKEQYDQISFKKFDFLEIMSSLKKLRNELSIQNKELALKISISSISNLFNQNHSPKINTLVSVCKNTLKVYHNAVSKKVSKKLSRAKVLSSSDIFWDKIKSIEKIKPKDKYVYDLSVKKNHSFVANGIIAHNTSLLGSLMLEINSKYRIITVEDSLELPIESLRKLKYNILRMKVRSALLKTTSEVSADDGIRTSLRLGDSSLIVGEVRSVEAKALYEAMRVGALANVVAGTIHGASPYGVYDRVVNDLGVPATSFKATDIIIICNPIKSADGLHSFRRVLQITEVRKHWEKDPLAEKGFVDLMRYNVEKDELEPTEDLINGDSEIVKEIASKVKGWAGNWDAVYDNILLRSEIKEELVKVAKETGKMKILEAEFNTLSNHIFHKISEEVIQEKGLPLKKYVLPLWKEWLQDEVKKI